METGDRAYSCITDRKVINIDFLKPMSSTVYHKFSFNVVNLEFLHNESSTIAQL